MQNETEFNDVRAACSVTLAHWNVLEATEDIIQASQTMQKEDLFWMCYSLAKLRTPIAIAHLEKQQTRDILLQHGIQDWLQKKDPNLEFHFYISRDFRGCKMRVSALWLSLLCLSQMSCMQSYILSRATYDNEKINYAIANKCKDFFIYCPNQRLIRDRKHYMSKVN